ncbi:Two-component system sensor histidine kinase [Arcticibacter svalbardensis MN12-7]|uniref:histidine kinase n=1 Tax=Arcticibacter svalbardensis MN12-7 TaxID=1150600 RepID=R9GSH8_9SPHI|nr:HAMP domain-containing sensor histidine kinase [Arcticibacter svalbardensis]EOR94515.1 Two-component system sensor histidine kinase [Arcticibacter svalbardensis MN12-7]
MKIKTKITLLFFLISTCGLILLNATIFYFVSEFSFEDFFERLEARVNLAAQIKIHPNEKSAAYHEIRTNYLEKLENERDYITKFEAGAGNRFKKPLNLPDQFYQDIINKKAKARYNEDNKFYAGELFETPYGKYIIIVAATDPYGFKELAELRRILIIFFIVSVILSFVAGNVFSYYTINPLSGIMKQVKNITANNLHLRLEELNGKDEIAELVQTFNNMLNRLETSFETQNNFVSNASHELRTPLTIITGETELLLSQKELTPETQQLIKTILSEAEKLGQILASLLGLAQTGFDGKKQNWQTIRVDELVMNVVALAKKIEPESIIDINFSGLPEDETKLYTEGNINLLQLALSNIVMNACKYSKNQPVEIKLNVENERLMISVTDKGIGIPLQDQQHIFEPFFRASNTSDYEGHGIGLPLTLNIIRLHKGSIGILSEEKSGTEIQIFLPVLKQ